MFEKNGKTSIQFGWSEKTVLQKMAGVCLYSSFSKPNYWYERTKRVQNHPRQLLFLIHDVHTKNFSNVIIQGFPVFDYRAIMGARNMEDGYIKPYKIQTFSPNSSKENLKWSKESSLDDPWCLHLFFKIKALRL